MAKIVGILAFVFSVHMAAQKLYVYPTEVTAPRGTYQTVTAIVTGLNDKTVSWSTSGGDIVGNNPCFVNEPCTIALHSDTLGTYHLKAVSNANHSLAGEVTVTFAASPTPVTSHPRLMITASMLPELRAKASPKNILYESIKARAELALQRDNEVWSWSCSGGTGEPAKDESEAYKEVDANLFAFLSMVSPTSAERNRWGCYGRDVWVYVMRQVMARPEIIHGNHWSNTSTQFALTTDWLMAGGYLNAADQQLARTFLAFIVKTILGYSYGSGAAVTDYNSPSQLLPDKVYSLIVLRAMGNNYTMSKMLYLVGAALTFNDSAADDPPLPNSCHAQRYQICPDYSGGSLHAYWNYFAGAMLYRMYAHLEEPAVSWPAFRAAFGGQSDPPRCIYVDGSWHPCLGDGRGGESSEGSWYQYSLYRLIYAFNMVHTAGYDDPIAYGPQLSLATSSWWDLKYVFDLAFLTGFGANGNESIPGYNYLTTGDSYTYVRTPGDFSAEAAMMVGDSYGGRKDRTNALHWLIVNAAFGGPLGKNGGCKMYCGFNSELANDYASSLAMDLMIALPGADPVSPLPMDPRPGIPTDLYNGSFNQNVILRSGKEPGLTLFASYCPNALIDHEHEFCGRFDVYSRGEYVTKGRTEFNDYNNLMSSATQSNTMSMLNTTGKNCSDSNCVVYNAVVEGGQFWYGEQQGFNLVTHSELPSYAGILMNDTPVYNGKWAYATPYDYPSYNDARSASRSLVYLRSNNQIVFYDRSITGHPAEKAVNVITTGSAATNGNVATWLTRSAKQRAYLTSVLPAQGVVKAVPLIPGGVDQKMDWEPAAALKISSGNIIAAEFLSVLEWGESSFSRTPVELVQSNGGDGFDGARIGTALVMFMRNWPTKFAGVTYPASGATTDYVSDLYPNSWYRVTGAGAPAEVESDSAGILAFSTSGLGNIQIVPKR